ncbi:MAG: hypothetical protein FJ317_09460, partial [SAR202 cluster bacterium]|nr:hypothetical protein [SAR202 cluster bacterium]
MLTVREGGELLGVAPLMRQASDIVLMGDPDLFDYQDFLPVKGKETPFFQKAFDFLCGQEWDALSLRSVKEHSPTLEHIPRLSKERGFSVRVEPDGVTPASSLPGTWEEYVAGLGKKERHELRRKLRRLEAAGAVRQVTCKDMDSLP